MSISKVFYNLINDKCVVFQSAESTSPKTHRNATGSHNFIKTTLLTTD